MSAVRSRDWKLVEHLGTGKTELYHLPDDLSEEHDVKQAHPEIASSLYQKLKQWRASMPRMTDINADGKTDLKDFNRMAQKWD